MNTGRHPGSATPNASEPQTAGSSAGGSIPRIIDSAALFLGQPLLLIRHHGDLYRLQTTRQGKLILTK
ncbi:MAG: hemin uptake protein HemP [Limnohabitans sp.]